MKVLFIILSLISLSLSFSLNYFNFGLSIVRERLEDILEISGQNTDCARDLRMLIADFIHRKPWALKMIDSSAKPNPGVMKGNFFHTGNFDQCLEIEEHVKDSWTIKGQYCNLVIMPSKLMHENSSFVKNLEEMIMALRLDIPVTPLYKTGRTVNKIPYGVCLPTSCTIGHLQKIWNYAETSLSTEFHVEFADALCDYKGKPYPNTMIDFYVWCIFAALILANVVSTAYDYFIYQKAKKPNEEMPIITMFSVYTNIQKIFSTTSEEGFLQCLNGLRVINMIWVIVGHRVLINAVTIPVNLFDVFAMAQKFPNMLVLSAPLAVDTFFFISGFLATYIFFVYRGQGKNLSTLELILARAVRIMTPLAVVILFYIGVWKYMSDGPYWKTLSGIVSGNCLKYWWRSLFCMDNFSPLINNCVIQAWYIGVDTQLYVMSPFILFYMTRKPKKALLILILTVVMSSLYAYMITVQYNLGAVILEANREYFELYYSATLIRMVPWIIGFIFGYFMVTWTEKGVNIPKIMTIILWIASLGGILLIIFPWHYSFMRDHDRYRSAVFNALSRPLWSLCIGWIVFACSLGYGGIINTFLCLPVFNVLAKVTYSMYLTHFAILLCRNASRRTASYFSRTEVFYELCGDLILIFIVSMMLCVMIESPLIALARKMLRKRKMDENYQQVTKATNTEKKKKRNKKSKVIVCLLSEDLKNKYLKED